VELFEYCVCQVGAQPSACELDRDVADRERAQVGPRVCQQPRDMRVRQFGAQCTVDHERVVVVVVVWLPAPGSLAYPAPDTTDAREGSIVCVDAKLLASI